MSVILRSKRDLLKRLTTTDVNPSSIIDDWFNDWIVGFYGKGLVLPEEDEEVYFDCEDRLDSARNSLKRSITNKLLHEDIFEEQADITRAKRVVQLWIFCLKERKDNE